MRKEYGRALRDIFTAEMKTHFPQFHPVKVASIYIAPGERAFRWIPEEPIHFWILLCPDQKAREAFTVEVGWSKLGRFPELSMRPSFEEPSGGREDFNIEEYVCRIGALMSQGDFWWELESLEIPDSPDDHMAYPQRQASPVSRQEAMEMVRPHVEDAIEKLRLHGLPYLEKLQSPSKLD